ncbi:unnamed protein product [Colias eurytheme]|nr:unnamed protein product [Colias eurytheme]
MRDFTILYDVYTASNINLGEINIVIASNVLVETSIAFNDYYTEEDADEVNIVGDDIGRVNEKMDTIMNKATGELRQIETDELQWTVYFD